MTVNKPDKFFRETLGTMDKRKGFTLIELLVVIAIIALLLSIMMPSLQSAKEKAKRIYCMSNLKNFTLIWIMYADNHDGRVPDGGTGYDECGYSIVDYRDVPWPWTDAPIELQEEALKKGVLWPYVETVKAYRCPTAGINEARTYVMPDSYSTCIDLSGTHGASEQMIIRNREQIKRPSSRMTFLDEGIASPVTWSIHYDQSRWWDPVPIRHGMGTTIGFADSHTEYWKWKDPRTIEWGKHCYSLENPDDASYERPIHEDNEDIERLVRAIWGNVGWE